MYTILVSAHTCILYVVSIHTCILYVVSAHTCILYWLVHTHVYYMWLVYTHVYCTWLVHTHTLVDKLNCFTDYRKKKRKEKKLPDPNDPPLTSLPHSRYIAVVYRGIKTKALLLPPVHNRLVRLSPLAS